MKEQTLNNICRHIDKMDVDIGNIWKAIIRIQEKIDVLENEND